ncbi:MAG: glutathione S-transferase family protein [Gallionellaceae bacterium]|nr:glutathione S-transferase family protein [Gallionellaceae bacterium]
MSKPLLIIGNKNYSSWSLRAWLMLKYAGVDFDEVRIPLFVEGYKQKLLTYSPAGKVPAYRDGEVLVWDTLAIGEYLYEAHPVLWPADKTARAHARSISAEMHSGFTALRKSMPMNIRGRDRQVETSPALEADIARIKSIWRELRKQYAHAGPWLFGKRSMTDCMFAPVAFRFQTYGVTEAGPVAEYVHTVTHDPLVQPWIQAGESEQEAVTANEVGK